MPQTWDKGKRGDKWVIGEGERRGKLKTHHCSYTRHHRTLVTTAKKMEHILSDC